jgi:hypothetical protein
MTSARASVDAETAPSAHRSYSQRSLPLMRSEYRRHLPPRGEQHEQLGPSAAPAAEGAVRDVHEGALEGRHGSGLARAGMRPETGLSRRAAIRCGHAAVTGFLTQRQGRCTCVAYAARWHAWHRDEATSRVLPDTCRTQVSRNTLTRHLTCAYELAVTRYRRDGHWRGEETNTGRRYRRGRSTLFRVTGNVPRPRRRRRARL